MRKYTIYYANLRKGLHDSNEKIRPVVIVGEEEKNVKVLAITSRYKSDKYHVKMNNFLIHGCCDVGNIYKINKKYILQYVRGCTESEVNAIENKLGKFEIKC